MSKYKRLGTTVAVVLGFFSFSSAFFSVAASSTPNGPSVNMVRLDGEITPSVKPILFVPKGLTPDASYLVSIDSAMETIAGWYATQLYGSTFAYSNAVEVGGQYELRYYCPKTTSQTQCIQVPGELGADPEDIFRVLEDLAQQGYRVSENTVLLVFWVGGYGFAAGAGSSTSGGWAAIGDWALEGLAGKYESGTSTGRCSDSRGAWLICRQQAQIGSVAHELGHAFGLGHPVDDGRPQSDPNWWLKSLMTVAWDFPSVVLLDSPANPEKQTLLAHRFFARWPPGLLMPPDGARMPSLGPAALYWRNPPGTTQYQLQVMPYGNDGPAINLIRNAETSYTIQPPVFGQGNYVMLPGMTYSWRVRATQKTTFAPENDLSWGPWSPWRTFRTPQPTSAGIRPESPANGSALASAEPVAIQWSNSATDIFYYEVQASLDLNFGAQGPVAAVWHNLVHGGVTTPLNSWLTPQLQPATTYYWRVRSRVQGDGTPVAWSATWSFRTP